jgi:hypothetical protein
LGRRAHQRPPLKQNQLSQHQVILMMSPERSKGLSVLDEHQGNAAFCCRVESVDDNSKQATTCGRRVEWHIRASGLPPFCSLGAGIK